MFTLAAILVYVFGLAWHRITNSFVLAYLASSQFGELSGKVACAGQLIRIWHSGLSKLLIARGYRIHSHDPKLNVW